MANSTLQFVIDIKQDIADSYGEDDHNKTRTAVNKTFDIQKNSIRAIEYNENQFKIQRSHSGNRFCYFE